MHKKLKMEIKEKFTLPFTNMEFKVVLSKREIKREREREREREGEREIEHTRDKAKKSFLCMCVNTQMHDIPISVF